MKRITFIFILTILWCFDGFSQPSITITASATKACAGENIVFTADTLGCQSDAKISWLLNGISVSEADTTVFSISTLANDDQISAVYTCLDSNGDSTDSATSGVITMEIDDPMAEAGESFVINKGESVVLNGSGNGTYSWGPSEGLSATDVADPTASPDVTTIYFLTVTSPDGCVSEDQTTVAVVLVVPMNTFTPNDDGYNDFWDIGGISSYPGAKVTVYDRWGQKVFNTTGYTSDKRWDGTNQGLPLQPSTYYFVIDLNSGGDDDVVAGYVTIIK